MAVKIFILILAFFSFLGIAFDNYVYASPKYRVALLVFSDQLTITPGSKLFLSNKLSETFPKDRYTFIEDSSLKTEFEKSISVKIIKTEDKNVERLFFNLSEKYNYDAILFLYYRYTASDSYLNLDNNKWEKEALVSLYAYMFDKKAKKYIYANDFSRAGTANLKTSKDLIKNDDILASGVDRCTEYLFSILELGSVERTLYLNRR